MDFGDYMSWRLIEAGAAVALVAVVGAAMFVRLWLKERKERS